MSHPKKLLLTYTLSGLMLGVGFVLPMLWPLGVVAVGIFFYALKETGSRKGAVIGGFITWFIKSLFAISWFWSTYPIEWMTFPLGKAELFLTGFYWLTVSLFLAGGGALFGVLCFEIKKGIQNVYYGLILFPISWVVSEIGSSLLFSVGTYGDGGTINTVFSFGYFGYLLGNHEGLIQLSRIGGVYILSLAGVALSYGLYLVSLKFSRQKSGLRVVAVVVVLGVSGLPVFYSHSAPSVTDGTTVAIIDTYFGGEAFHNRDDSVAYKNLELQEAVKSALLFETDYIILPEDSRYFSTSVSSEASYRSFRFLNADSPVIIVDSGRTAITDDEVALRSTIYDGISKKGFAVDKQYLVPQGEFLPQFYLISLTVLGAGETIKKIGGMLAYRPGPFASQSDLPSVVPGVLFCFESADPNGVRRLMNEREVPFISHPISHAWFHESKVLWQQQDVMLKIQALWNKVHIVSAGNMASGALYTKDGKKIDPKLMAEGESWKVGLISW